MEKLAQKGVKDPVQQALRNLKKEWNQEVKVLIAQIIAFKRGINGKGDIKAGLPQSDIKNPLPPEISQYLLEMTDRYNRVIEMSKNIIESQKSYSENRRKSQKELTANEDYAIIKEANVLSRWWTWMKQYPLFSSDELTKDRLSLMNISSDLSDRLNDVESILVGTGSNQIYNSYNDYKAVLNLIEVNFIKKLNDVIKAKLESDSLKKELLKNINLEKEKQETSEQISGHNENVEYLQKYNEISDFINQPIDGIRYHLSELSKEGKIQDKEYQDYQNLSIKLKQKYDEYEFNKTEDNLQDLFIEFDNIKDYIISLSAGLFNKNNIDFYEAVSLLNTVVRADEENNEIQKLASKRLQRWINRMRLGLFSNDIDRLRVNVAKELNEASAILLNISKQLEENNESLHTILTEVSRLCLLLSSVAYSYIRAAEIHNAEYYVNRGDKNKKLYKIEGIPQMEKLKDKFEGFAAEFIKLSEPEEKKEEHKQETNEQ